MSYRNVVYNGRNRCVNLFTWDTDGKRVMHASNIIHRRCSPPLKWQTAGRVWRRYCELHPDPLPICEFVTHLAFFTEFFVYGHPKAINHPDARLDLLQQAREEIGLCKECIIPEDY